MFLTVKPVGITGWSFGGYFSAMAAMRRPDIYKAAVAGAPVCDFRDYDTHYTERYMGLPSENAEDYKRCAAPTYAGDLRRPLMLIHGTTDDNVYFTHTIKLTEALFRAGRPYDLMILPGFTHMVPEPIVNVRLYERIVGYFKEHLVDSRPAAIGTAPRR
jgi:dipeptidyl-peptidase-4